MAVRIEFFTIAGTGDFELVEPASLEAAVTAFDAGTGRDADGPVRCVGWVSASDGDEDRFTDWCAEIDDDLGVGFLQQGVGEAVGLAPPPAVPATAGAGDDPCAAAWGAAVRAALVAAAGGRLGWRTNFDVSGAAVPGDDYPTAASPASV